MITIDNLSLHLNNQSILDNISCTFPRGHITLLIGSSGAGKTSLLRCLVQLQRKYTGVISIDGTNVATLSDQDRAQLIGYVAQEYNLFTHLTALENCIQPLHVVLGQPVTQAREQALQMFHQLDIGTLAEKYPHQLSGGQRQRVAIARTLCFNPRTLIFDEPTAALDPVNTAHVARLLKSLLNSDKSIIISTHDRLFAQQLVDIIFYMHAGTLVKINDLTEKLSVS